MDALVCGEAKQRTKMKKIHQNSIRQYETGANFGAKIGAKNSAER